MDDTPSEDLNDTIRFTTVKQKQKKLLTVCKICGAPALYSYFGVVVCGSCKIFFRRNVQMRQGQSKCVYGGHCQINSNNRHICTSCRLAKCFASGMKAELIRGPRTAKKNTNQTEKLPTIATVPAIQKQKDQIQQLPIFNLLRSDHSTLTIDQWNLLSNLTHCYDEYSGFSLVQRFMQEQNQLPPKMRFKLTTVSELFTSITNAGQLLYEKNADFVTLCPHDRSILLHNMMKYAAGFGTCFILRHTRLLDNAGLCKSIEVIYGSATLATGQRTVDQLDFEGTFIKLVLALLTFFTSGYVGYANMVSVNLENIKAVLHVQDMYSELVWRYLLYKYDHERAVLCFSNLIRCLVSLNDTLIEAVKNKPYTDMIDSLVRRTEETLAITD